MNRQTFEHQEKGVELLKKHNRFGLFWDCGLMKTFTVLRAIKEQGIPAIIVGTESSKMTWEEENEDIKCNISHFNYNSFQKLSKQDIKGKALVFDEAHHIKNRDAQRSLKAIELAYSGAEKVFLLTGSPIADKPMDLYMMLVMLGQRDFYEKEYYMFRSKYAILRKKVIGYDRMRKQPKYAMEIVGFRNLEQLRKELEPVSQVLKLTEVLDMPPAKLIPIYYDLNSAERHEYQELEKEHHINLLTFCSKLSAERAKTLIEDLLEETQEKIAVYSNYIATVETLSKYFKAPKLLGSMDSEERKEAKRQFQNDSRLLVSTYKTGSESLNLQFASYEILTDLPEYLLEYKQTLMRIYRGLQSKPCFYYMLIPKNTIIEKVFKRLDEKFNLITKVFPGDKDFDIMGLLKESLNA
jgi:SNF2 family DNA or RNA helicase